MPDAVKREKLLPTDPGEAWDALTDPERMANWLGEPIEADLQAGGDLRVRLPGGEERSGWVEEAEAPRRLTFWWAAEGAESTRVELTLEPADGGTRVVVTESRPLTALGDELQGATRGPQALALAG